jgi:hypothetical protein
VGKLSNEVASKKLKIWPIFTINFIVGMHPEVKQYIGFIHPLYAEKANNFVFGQSAGECHPTMYSLCSIQGTISSETLRGKVLQEYSTLSSKRPKNKKQWGAYLAGLVEGDGHFSNKQNIQIAFCLADQPLALFLQKKFSFGKVVKIKNKNAVSWNIYNKKEVIAFLNIIDGFLRTEYKLAQVHQNMANLIHSNYQKVPNSSNILESWWLAGFTEADGCFYVQILAPRKHRRTHEIRVQYKFSLRENQILFQLKEIFGSSVYKRTHSYHSTGGENIEKKITYYWSSTTFEAAYKVCSYFQKNSLQGSKWISFQKWCHILLLVKNKVHFTPEGLQTIKQLKKSMNVFMGGDKNT